MNTKQLDIAKKIANITGVSIYEKGEHLLTPDDQGYMFHEGQTCDWYNPFEWGVLGELMDKYKVSIQQAQEYVFITQGWTDVEVSFGEDSGDSLKEAVLKCIIKACGTNLLTYDGAGITSTIEFCANTGCGLNNEGLCTAQGTECFGYIKVVDQP